MDKVKNPLHSPKDITSAGFNVQMNRPTNSQGSVTADPDKRLTLVWNNPRDAADWLVDVGGEHKVTTCEGCERSTYPVVD